MSSDRPQFPTIPASWEAIDAEWMTAALAARVPGAVVSEVELILRDDGTNRRARFGLTYSSGSGPASVFLKAADPAHTQLNASTGGVFNEALLFLADVALPVDHPGVYRVLIDEPALDFLMVMEDITARGGDPRDATRPLSVAQAAHGVRALARLHSAYWGDRLDRQPALSWVEPFHAWSGMARGIDVGIRRAGDRIPATVRELSGDRIEGDHWARYVTTLADGPATLLHGDPHIGNTYVLPGDEVGFLDWQVLRRGNFSLDLGYFLQGAVTVEDRRSSEAELLAEYRHALDLPDAEAPSAEEVWLRYRASVAHGLAIWLATAASTWQRPEVSLALSGRYAAAFVDLDTPSAIDELIA
ncbi:MAG TPA: phosphotransferase [Microthrixaceae bacterium]|nr:phosphotransferase [Microthrixaceae bacterium]